jgi:hypothetical protein
MGKKQKFVVQDHCGPFVAKKRIPIYVRAGYKPFLLMEGDMILIVGFTNKNKTVHFLAVELTDELLPARSSKVFQNVLKCQLEHGFEYYFKRPMFMEIENYEQ